MEETPIRTYTKSQLCNLYSCCNKTLNKWIHKNETCMTLLSQVGYEKTMSILNPLMVEIIFECIGNPRKKLNEVLQNNS